MRHLETKYFEADVEFYLYYLKNLGYSESTLDEYTMRVKEFLYFCEARFAASTKADLTQEMVSAYFLYLEVRPNARRAGGLSPSYLLKQRSALTTWCVCLRDMLDIHLHFTFPSYKAAKATPNLLTERELLILLDGCADTPEGRRNAAVMALMWFGALRRSETMGLNLEDVDLYRRTIRVLTPVKNGHERLITFSEKALPYLERYLDYRDYFGKGDGTIDPALFLSCRCKRMHGDTIRFLILKEVKACRLPRLRMMSIKPHDLRHSSITNRAYRGEETLFELMSWTGHRCVDSITKYLHYVELLKALEDETAE